MLFGLIRRRGLNVQTGIGGTLGDLILIIGFGAMLGKLVAESGAAQRMTDALINLFGEKYLQWGLALAGFIGLQAWAIMQSGLV